jgi:hypothetical protein
MSCKKITSEERNVAVLLSEMLNNAIRAQNKAKAVRTAEAVILFLG